MIDKQNTLLRIEIMLFLLSTLFGGSWFQTCSLKFLSIDVKARKVVKVFSFREEKCSHYIKPLDVIITLGWKPFVLISIFFHLILLLQMWKKLLWKYSCITLHGGSMMHYLWSRLKSNCLTLVRCCCKIKSSSPLPRCK